MLDVSSARIYEHVRYLAEEIGPRVFGTEAEKKATEYAADKFREYGMDTRIETFRSMGFILKKAELVTIKPIRKKIDCISLIYSGISREGVIGQLVCVGSGEDREYRRKDVKDKIALVMQPERLVNQPVTMYMESIKRIATTAIKRNAAGIVIFSREGPPCCTSLEVTNELSIPSVAISSSDGQKLLMQLLNEREVVMHLKVDAEKKKVESCNAIGTWEGKKWPEEKVIVGAHIDTVIGSPGASDNASGVAAVLEISRNLAGKNPKRTLEFITFGGEEVGFYGSKYYVEKQKEKKKNIVAAIAIDNAGTGVKIDNRLCIKTKYLHEKKEMNTSEWLNQLLYNAAKKLEYEIQMIPIPGGSDHVPFLLNDIPAAFIRWMDDPWWHTPEDKILNIDAEKIRKIALISKNVMWKVANST